MILHISAYCVDTHWHASHYSPPAFDRPRSKQGDTNETRWMRRRSRQKPNFQLSHPSVHTNYIWSASCLHPRWPSHASARSSHGFDQRASNVLWWILTQSSLNQRTLINVGVNDAQYAINQVTLVYSQERYYIVDFDRQCLSINVCHPSITHMYINPLLLSKSYFYSDVQKRPLSYTLLSLHQYATRRHLTPHVSIW